MEYKKSILIKQGNGYCKRILFPATVKNNNTSRINDNVLGAFDTGTYYSLISPRLFTQLTNNKDTYGDHFVIMIADTIQLNIFLINYDKIGTAEDIDILLGMDFISVLSHFSILKHNNDLFLYLSTFDGEKLDFSRYWDMSGEQNRIINLSNK